VAYIPRPMKFGDRDRWTPWLLTDQRAVADRTDVLSYVSEPLTAPLKIAGVPKVNLTASTSGSDADWVVKLIDVYPDEVPSQPELGGYQLAVGMDIFRGPVSRELQRSQGDQAEHAAEVPVHPADRELHLPAGPPDHGAGPVQLVSAV
jgi:predicted acyl esterase